MRRHIAFPLLAALILGLALSGTALAQGIVHPQHSDPAWQASYWNNTDLSGPAVLQREDPNIDFDWGTGSPDSRIVSNGFSARWTRYLDTAGGTYRFTATADDGIRVAIDGRWIINEWNEHPARTYTADVNLGAEHHLVTVEYYENGGNAVAKLSWGPAAAVVPTATPSVQNWRGEYFNNMMLSGSPALVRDDAQINFDWGTGSPLGGTINADRFSARWTRTADLPAGNYHFSATADDGVRLWVNNHLLIDVWQEQAAHTYTGDIYLPGGPTGIRMEYFEMTGAAVARLSWSTDGSAPTPLPPTTGEVIVDDADPGFSKGGSSSGWRSADEGYGGHEFWTLNNDRVRPNYDWARWQPNLAPARYEVYVYIPERYTTTAGARYWVHHAGGFTQQIVDQSAHGSQWVSLGTYQFQGSSEDYLSVADVTYEPYLSRLIGVDAAKWVPR